MRTRTCTIIATLLVAACDGSTNDGSGGGSTVATTISGATTPTSGPTTSAQSTRAAQNAAATGTGGSAPEARVDLAAGFGVAPYHACVIKPDHAVGCFGAHQPRATPPEGFRAIAISSGHLHNCALLTDDAEEKVGCYGFGYDGGNLPNEPPEGIDAVQVAVGEGTSCAVDVEGKVTCWYGGDLETDPPDELRAKQVSTTAAFSCAIDTDDEVVCWGLNPPDLPESPLRARFIVTAQSEATMDPPESRVRRACAIRFDDTVVCWGDDQEGEIDDVPDGLEAVDIAIGHTESCAVNLDGELVCWGRAPGGFQRPEGTIQARAVRISGNNGCALREDEDRLICWGFNDPDRYEDGIPDGVEVWVPPR